MKLFLAAVIVAGCVTAGFSKAAELRDRPGQLRSLQLGVNILATEIGSLATPLPKALQMVAEGTKGPVSQLWSAAAAELDSGMGIPFSDVWEHCQAVFSPYLALAADDWQVLQGLGSFLGRSDREDQVAQLRTLATKLASLEQQALYQYERLARLYQYSGWAVGLGLCLFLL